MHTRRLLTTPCDKNDPGALSLQYSPCTHRAHPTTPKPRGVFELQPFYRQTCFGCHARCGFELPHNPRKSYSAGVLYIITDRNNGYKAMPWRIPQVYEDTLYAVKGHNAECRVNDLLHSRCIYSVNDSLRYAKPFDVPTGTSGIQISIDT